MTILERACFICAGTMFDQLSTEYRRCLQCGHEILVKTQAQDFIINDSMTVKDVRKVTSLDRFRTKVLCTFDRDIKKKQLLDIGSASGKFLLHNSSRYERAFGIEITPEAVAFSQKILGLKIFNGLEQVPRGTCIATAWHSLEHIPEGTLLVMLDTLSRNMEEGARLIVSVPNGASWQYQWFGNAFAFFDVPAHLHQFTTDSLSRLLAKFGYRRVAIVNSWPYNTFGWTQSLLNKVTNTHNYLYYRLKRRSRKPSLPMDLLHLLLLPIFVPVGWLMALVDSLSHEKQGVITVCFEKKTS